jgi:hypothetical protein
VVAGKFLLASDNAGIISSYSPSTNSWTQVTAGTNQIVSNGTAMAFLSLSHAGVFQNTTGTGGGWTQIGGAASELFVGSGSNIAATMFTTSRDILYYQGTPNSWVDNGSLAANSYAITGANTLFRVSTNRSAIQQSSNTSQTSPPWNAINTPGAAGSIGRLIGHGNNLYSTAGITY